MPPEPLYCDNETEEPPLTVAPVYPMPPKMEVPPDTLTPDLRVGVEEADTTIVVPPLEGVLKAKTVLPYVNEYQVLLLHEEVE